jgi:hypothetical protein
VLDDGMQRAAWEAGRMLTLEEAVEIAMKEANASSEL